MFSLVPEGNQQIKILESRTLKIRRILYGFSFLTITGQTVNNECLSEATPCNVYFRRIKPNYYEDDLPHSEVTLVRFN